MTNKALQDRIRKETKALRDAGSLGAYMKTLPDERLEEIAENKFEKAGDEEALIGMLGLTNLYMMTGRKEYKLDEMNTALQDVILHAALEALMRKGLIEMVKKDGKTRYRVKEPRGSG